ncbi:hypothetical protein ACQZ6F_29480 [Rhizobium sp. A22-96]
MTSNGLPSAWRENFYSLFPGEKHVIDEKNAQAIGAIVARASAGGLLNSGSTMSQIATELANSIPERVSLSIAIVRKVIAAHGESISGENKSELIALLQKLVVDQQDQLKHKALSTPPFRSAPQAARDAALNYIDLKANLEINRIVGEINLMAAKKPALTPLDSTAYEILALLKEEFVSAGRASTELANSYVGPSLPGIQQAIMTDGAVSQVDFDLSLSALENNQMVQTGPMVPFENKPGSSIMVLGVFSKREYLSLTEDGYRAANRPEARTPHATHGHSITIKDSHFHNSPVGAGTSVTQTVAFDVTNENETVNYLYELLSHNNGKVDASAKQEIKAMVDAANAGDMKAAKPIFQKLFGGAADAVKELGIGVLTAIVNKQLGMDG